MCLSLKMTEGKWNCMWPMVLGRCVPKTGLTRVAWAWALTWDWNLGHFITLKTGEVCSHSGEIWLTWVELSVRLINICPFFFLSHPCWDNSPQSSPESLAFWNPCWAQLHGDLMTGLSESCLKSLSITLRKPCPVLLFDFYELILIKPYSECWIGCTEVPVENKRKKKMVSLFLFQKPLQIN